MKFFSTYSVVFFVVAGFLSITSISCDRPNVRASNSLSGEILFHEEDSVKVTKMPLIITYHLDSIATPEEAHGVKEKFSEEDWRIILALNRIDANYIRPGKTLVIPDTITGNFMDYSPFPENFEMLQSIPKTVLISKRVQAFALYESGRLIRWGPVSTGKASSPTPEGLFYGNYKARRKISTVNGSWIMPYYFNIMNYHGVGVHHYAMPGYPASHACVRLKLEDAMMIYDWAQQWKLDNRGREILRNGTPFMVYGDYDFKSPAPWLSLVENHNSNFLSAEEMDILRGYTNAYFKDKKNFDPSPIPERTLVNPPQEGLETIR